MNIGKTKSWDKNQLLAYIMSTTFVRNIWHLPVDLGIHFQDICVPFWAYVPLWFWERWAQCWLLLQMGFAPAVLAIESVLLSHSARPCSVPNTSDNPPYEDSVCLSSCIRQLGYECRIGFTAECLNTGRNCVCFSEEGKQSCLNLPTAACRKATWYWMYCQGEGANQSRATWWGCCSILETTSKMPGARDLRPTPGNSVVGGECQCCKWNARCDGAMEWVKAAGQRLHTSYFL